MTKSEPAGTDVIDIMMPFYGDPAMFRDAVESVRAQHDPHWRLVVIDDRYPDPAPGEWLLGLGDDRIVYVRNEQNLGVSGNFAKSVRLAESTLAVIFGCDDLMLPGYVGRMRALAELYPDAAYLQPGVEVIGSDGAPSMPLADRVKAHYRPRVSGAHQMRGEALAVSLLRGNWTYFPSICWRTAVLRSHGFRADLEVVLDLALQLDIVFDGGTLVVDDTTTFRYRRHGASVSSWAANDGSRFIEEHNFFVEVADRSRAAGWRSAARMAAVHFSSRLNALTRMPAALLSRDGRGLLSLLGHVFGGSSARVLSERMPPADC